MIVCVTLSLAILILGTGEGSKLRAQVPALGRVFGTRINVDSQGDLERVIGKGKPMMGGHSGGARIWKDPTHGWVITTDGFELSPYTRKPEAFLEAISFRVLDPKDKMPGLPTIPKRAQYGAFDRLRPGMSPADLCRMLALPGAVWEGNMITQKGRATIRHLTNPQTQRITRWQARFTFDHYRLVGFDLTAK